MARRDYGTGSVHQRKDGMWIGTLEAGTTAKGTRRRVTVSAKTEAACKKRLRDKRLQIEQGGIPEVSDRTTVKTWAATWLDIKSGSLSPKAYNAAASAVNKWIVPTIGHKRLGVLGPADVRALAQAQIKAGNKGTAAAATQRVLMTMLRAAMVEGHAVPPRVLLTPAPTTSKSDRMDIPVADSVRCLAVAAQLPHGTRWAFALLHGMRQGECLGLTWECVDLERGLVTVEWQLQRVPYIDNKNKRLGFRTPAEYDCRHLVDSFHLVRPKTKQGWREIPLSQGMWDAMRAWRLVAPDNPYDLVWPAESGRPADNKRDLEEWHALQGTAEVGHPGGRYYHVHECRNVTATQLRDAGGDETVITALLGHASITTSRGYMRVNTEAKRAAMEAVAALLPFTPDAPAAAPYEPGASPSA